METETEQLELPLLIEPRPEGIQLSFPASFLELAAVFRTAETFFAFVDAVEHRQAS